MINICTLFDSNYLSRGLSMYESLKTYCENYHLYIFAFDDKCFEVLKKLNLSKVSVVSLREFEDEKLLSIKPTRSKTEYCWTCTPSIILYILNNYNLESCTYLDADIYFYSSPEVLLDELDNNSVIITEHKYTAKYDQSRKSGRFCVQFITFKGDDKGLKVLKWWRDACIDWCYARFENGKFGDQKYLDDWPERFEGVHVLRHLGGGLAPWNIQQYEIYKKDGRLQGKEIESSKEFLPIFFHFHHLKFYSHGEIDMGGYKLSNTVKELIYKPYIRHLDKIKYDLTKLDGNLDPHGSHQFLWRDYKNTLRYIKRKFLLNIVDKQDFLRA